MSGRSSKARNSPEGEVLTFAVLTTEPNTLMADIHNRMPVIVKPEDYGRWLDPGLSDVAELQKLVGPYPECFMEAFLPLEIASI
ncbi:MAG: SOS response-associated peptidase family protein [bacterium]|jgi:putative SOS response-associated peptidase YedK